MSEIMNRLAAPFDAKEIKWKPQATNGNRALAVAYVDARVVQDRLDEVLGIAGWRDAYELLANGCVACRLSVKINGDWITKMDVGGQSKQPEVGDKLKSAFSDAFKRTAVKFGVGRYLYRVANQWVDYDPQKKRFLKTPTLPAAALPAPNPKSAQSAPAGTNGHPNAAATGADFEKKIQDLAAKWQKAGYCTPEALHRHLRKWAADQKFAKPYGEWPLELTANVRGFLVQLCDYLKQPAPDEMQMTILHLAYKLGWSQEYQEERLANANLLQPGEIPNEHKAQAIILYLQQELRDAEGPDEEETEAGQAEEIPF